MMLMTPPSSLADIMPSGRFPSITPKPIGTSSSGSIPRPTARYRSTPPITIRRALCQVRCVKPCARLLRTVSHMVGLLWLGLLRLLFVSAEDAVHQPDEQRQQKEGSERHAHPGQGRRQSESEVTHSQPPFMFAAH